MKSFFQPQASNEAGLLVRHSRSSELAFYLLRRWLLVLCQLELGIPFLASRSLLGGLSALTNAISFTRLGVTLIAFGQKAWLAVIYNQFVGFRAAKRKLTTSRATCSAAPSTIEIFNGRQEEVALDPGLSLRLQTPTKTTWSIFAPSTNTS